MVCIIVVWVFGEFSEKTKKKGGTQYRSVTILRGMASSYKVVHVVHLYPNACKTAT